MRVLFFTVCLVFCESKIVHLPNGRIRGRTDISLNKNVHFYAFQDIPYAEPPVGALRFQSPVPLTSKWAEIRDCTENKRICFQINSNSPLENEDCLYLNVYTPILDNCDVLLPVFVYIHGGGFYKGNSTFNYLGPHYFMENSIVVVTLNYRLGPFGFLSTGDNVVAGNAGLKDQNLALKWVQQNIHLFNGDPRRVTIGGQSTGAAAVSYHVLSEISRGLFRGAIQMSGSALSTRTFQPNPRLRAINFAKIVGKSFDWKSSSKDLLVFLQGVNASDLDAASDLYYDSARTMVLFNSLFWSPVLEVESEEAFLTQGMYKLMKNGKFNRVPLLIGIVSEDGLLGALNYTGMVESFQTFDTNVSTLVPNNFHVENELESQRIGQKIKEIYGNVSFSDDLGAGVRFLSDSAFAKGLIKNALLHSGYADVYMYQFSYNGSLGRNQISFPGTGKVTHAEDLHYLWASNNFSDPSRLYDEMDVLTLERFVRLFSNFVKTMNPTPEEECELLGDIRWPKLKKNSKKTVFLNINATLEIQEGLREPATSGWQHLYKKEEEKLCTTF